MKAWRIGGLGVREGFPEERDKPKPERELNEEWNKNFPEREQHSPKGAGAEGNTVDNIWRMERRSVSVA